MKRTFDVLATILLLVLLSPCLALCCLSVILSSKGPIFHISDRVGKNNSRFRMVKFRTMQESSPQRATHLMQNRESFLTPVGQFLRKSSLDELPQLINVLRGEMSLVGPRPSLFNQDDQIELRTASGCHVLIPGMTGWAQVNGRDRISIARKVELDTWYFHNRSILLDLKILVMTVWQVFQGEGK